MKKIKVGAALCIAALLAMAQANAAPADKGKDPKKDSIESVLASVPLPELPAKAADLIFDAKPKDRDEVALAVVLYAATARAASITPVVSSVAKALPESAAAVAAAAVKLVPNEAQAIRQAALNAAPGYAEQITRALGAAQETGVPVAVTNPGNRPTVPPGLEHSNGQGAIRGNRPEIPPGLVRDPKPGRDPQRRRYGSP